MEERGLRRRRERMVRDQLAVANGIAPVRQAGVIAVTHLTQW